MGSCWQILRARIEQVRQNPEGGYTTETVVVTALLVIAALAVVAIIVGKVTAKARGIDLG